MTAEFVHLHVHSEYSLLDGLGRVNQLVKQAASLGQRAMALTDHGTMHGIIEFARACQKAGIKPIVGVEAYLTRYDRPMDGRDPVLDKERHHLLLLAENQAGYRNLLRICSHAQLDGYYYRPRIDKAFLEKHAEGLICTSGCLAAEVPKLLNQGREREAIERVHWYRDVFGPGRFFLELQEHSIPELDVVNRQLIDFSRKYDMPLIATNDVHYVKPTDASPHDVLLCVQTTTTVDAKERMRMSDGSYYVRSGEEMERLFGHYPGALSNTLLVADMCNVDVEDKTYHLPPFDVPSGHDYQSYLRILTEGGVQRRYGARADDPELRARVEYELQVIHDMGFDVYFLIVSDLCRYARERGIWYNVRGSGAGSVVAYATGITNLDPLPNNLIFERFLNPGRVSMPDFDLDFPDDQREELIRYTIDKYGEDRVAQIVTFGRMKARAAVRDVGRAMGVPLAEVDQVAKLIPAIPGKPVSIAEALQQIPDLKLRYDGAPHIKQLLDTASEIEGVARHASIHAAAVIVADQPLVNYTPLMRPPKSAITRTITQYEFPILESIGLLKVDFLGLSTLSVMREATRLISERHGKHFTLENIPLDDAESYRLLASGEVTGVFQVEGAGMRRVLMEMQPREFNHIVATISLYRPGPMDFIPEYIACLHGTKQPHYIHPALEPILSETFGVCIYQEQIIQLLTRVAGYTSAEADLVRRAISKKKADVIEKERESFARGAKATSGLTRSEADQIWDALQGFARYGFNRAHAADYAVICVQTAYLKAHYPLEFMAAQLLVERDKSDKVANFITECRRMGIEVLPPAIDASGLDFTIEMRTPDAPPPMGQDPHIGYRFPIPKGAAIRFGLGAIKNVGEGPVETIITARAAGGPFFSLEDLCQRVDLRRVTRRPLECLIKAGALDGFGERAQLIEAIDAMIAESAAAHDAREVGQLSIFDLFSGGGAAATPAITIRLPKVEAAKARQLLNWEKELLGVYASSHPLQQVTVDIGDLVTCACGAVDATLAGTPVTLIGMLADVKQIITKKGDPMGFATLEDMGGTVELTIFPRTYAEVRDRLAVEKVVMVRGKVDAREGGRVSVLVDTVQDYVDRATAVVSDRPGPANGAGNGRSNGPQYGWSRPVVETTAAAGTVTLARPRGPIAGAWYDFSGDEEDDELDRVAPIEVDDEGEEEPSLPLALDHAPTIAGAQPLPLARAGRRRVHVTLRQGRSAEDDIRHLGQIYTLMAQHYRGPDVFCLYVMRSGERMMLEFPNDGTNYGPELQQELVQLVGVENVRVEAA